MPLTVPLLPRDDPSPRSRLDVVGLALLAPGLVGVLYGLSNASKPAGFARADVLVPSLVGLSLVAAFAIYSAQSAGHAIVDPELRVAREPDAYVSSLGRWNRPRPA